VDVADAAWKVNLGLAAMKDRYVVSLPGEQANNVWADEPGSTEDKDSQCATSIAAAGRAELARDFEAKTSVGTQ
jgi:hypothetical protein